MGRGSRPMSERDLGHVIERLLGYRVQRFDWGGRDRRLYSAVHQVDVVTDAGRLPLVVKTWSDTNTCRLQLEAINRARDVFGDDDGVTIPFLAGDTSSRVLVMERIPDPSIESLAHFAPGADGLNVGRWQRRLARACLSAGQWLRRWHGHDNGRGAVGELLAQYLADRRTQLELLPAGERRALEHFVGGLGDGEVCAVHGDFTPWNVLWSASRFTVLDFGIGEWRQMSPAWDLATMKIGLASELLFATRSPARWHNRLVWRQLSAFDAGYGDVRCAPSVVDACAAVRHLNLYAADIEGGRAVRKRAAWHRQQIGALLQRNGALGARKPIAKAPVAV